MYDAMKRQTETVQLPCSNTEDNGTDYYKRREDFERNVCTHIDYILRVMSNLCFDDLCWIDLVKR